MNERIEGLVNPLRICQANKKPSFYVRFSKFKKKCRKGVPGSVRDGTNLYSVRLVQVRIAIKSFFKNLSLGVSNPFVSLFWTKIQKNNFPPHSHFLCQSDNIGKSIVDFYIKIYH